MYVRLRIPTKKSVAALQSVDSDRNCGVKIISDFIHYSPFVVVS